MNGFVQQISMKASYSNPWLLQLNFKVQKQKFSSSPHWPFSSHIHPRQRSYQLKLSTQLNWTSREFFKLLGELQLIWKLQLKIEVRLVASFRAHESNTFAVLSNSQKFWVKTFKPPELRTQNRSILELRSILQLVISRLGITFESLSYSG